MVAVSRLRAESTGAVVTRWRRMVGKWLHEAEWRREGERFVRVEPEKTLAAMRAVESAFSEALEIACELRAALEPGAKFLTLLRGVILSVEQAKDADGRNILE